MMRFTPSGFSNEVLMIEWTEKVLLPFIKSKNEDEHVWVFVLDAASFHAGDNMRKLLKSSGVELIVIPGGCTDFLQPLDVSLNKPLKDRVRERYHFWLEKSYGKEHF